MTRRATGSTLSLGLFAILGTLCALPVVAVADQLDPGCYPREFDDTSVLDPDRYHACRGLYFVASGYDLDNDGQPDAFDSDADGQPDTLARDTGLTMPNPEAGGAPIPLFIDGALGGITAPMAYYPRAAEIHTERGLETLIGDGTFSQPQAGSALDYRSVLYATSGSDALKAFYTNAIREFTGNLGTLLNAEEEFRIALRVNPFSEGALDGLLEVFYARAEGFMLIGNEYMAQAYRWKFDRDPDESHAIVDLELGSIESALRSYDTGIREFMKLFNREFYGSGQRRKPHLDLNAEQLFFERRISGEAELGEPALISIESRRGQANSVGHTTRAFASTDSDIDEIFPVQGSPSISSSAAQASQLDAVEAPIIFGMPRVETPGECSDDDVLCVTFYADISDDHPVMAMELLIEFDSDKLRTPGFADIDVGSSDLEPTSVEAFWPNSTHRGMRLYGNQILVRLEAGTPLIGANREILTVRFQAHSDSPVGALDGVSVYVGGSGGALATGFKDLAMLYRLAAAHVSATAEKARRIYTLSDSDTTAEILEEEVQRATEWADHFAHLLEISADAGQAERIDGLAEARSRLSASLNGLIALREFVRSEANVYGFPDDYIPFFNTNDIDTFTAIRNLVIGPGAPGSFNARTAAGYFGTARDSETAAIGLKDTWEHTKDRIRNEIFTINEQAESRLLQICGRVTTNEDGEPIVSYDTDDDIDYDLAVATQNPASEIGQNVLLLQRAEAGLDQANADIDQLKKQIELERRYLQDAVALKEEIPEIIGEHSAMQQNLDRKIGEVNAKQARLRAVTEATQILLKGQGISKWFSGESGFAGVSATITLANGLAQANMEKQKGELQAEKTRIAANERIALTAIDTELFKLSELKMIESLVNSLEVKVIGAQIAELDVQVALGRLNQLINERDELLARKGRAVANLGEMSFADPSFRLTQFNVMKEAEVDLEYLKKWLFLMTRTLTYKWALADDYSFDGNGNDDNPGVSIDDINRIQVVGALSKSPPAGAIALGDTLTAVDYVEQLIEFDNQAPVALALSEQQFNPLTNLTARYSLREDFLHIVRRDHSSQEPARVRGEFRDWLTAPERFDVEGNLVITFDTIGHLDNYDQPVDPQSVNDRGTWKNFALRDISYNELWNHKITEVGVAFRAHGLAFKPGVSSVHGSIQYGGTGYVRRDSLDYDVEFNAYQMRQWKAVHNGGLEPIDVRTIGFDAIPSSLGYESNPSAYANGNLAERPVAATLWRLIIPASQVALLELDNIQDIFIYISSKAYLVQ